MTSRRSGGRLGTERELREMLHNPVYAGVGPYPRMVDDDTWVKAMCVNVKQDGSVAVLSLMRQVLNKALGFNVESLEHPLWLENAANAIASQGAAQFFRQLLAQLRSELGGPLESAS